MRPLAAHTIFDHALFAFLLVATAVEYRWVWPRFLARIASGEPGVRSAFYRAVVYGQWMLTLVLLAYWAWQGRPWTWLRLGPAPPLRLGIGMAVAVLFTGFLVWQRFAVLRNENAIAKVRPQLENAAPLLPHTCTENRRFKVVSVTAGVCEETLFRGFLLWYFAVWAGTAGGILLSSLVFGLGHLYLGRAHVLKTTLAGIFFACLVVASESLWPAILVHVAMDWNSGEIGYRILSGAAPKNANS
jgi:membrane protease YdiL (CAAX protease family)